MYPLQKDVRPYELGYGPGVDLRQQNSVPSVGHACEARRTSIRSTRVPCDHDQDRSSRMMVRKSAPATCCCLSRGQSLLLHSTLSPFRFRFCNCRQTQCECVPIRTLARSYNNKCQQRCYLHKSSGHSMVSISFFQLNPCRF